MRTFATPVLYERRGKLGIGYRAETIEQITHVDLAEGTQGAWELRSWMPAGARPGYGVRADELASLMGATFRVINHCLGDDTPSAAVRRFHCARSGGVSDMPASQPLPEHLMVWNNQAASDEVFLQTRGVDAAQLRAIGHQLQHEIEAMVKVKDELLGQSAPASSRS